MILDHTDDEGRYLRLAFADKGVPAVVKTAADVTKCQVKHAEDYAFPERMKYPLVDAGNTVASAVYFSHYGGQLPDADQKKVASAIQDALTDYGLAAPPEITKAASIQLGYSGEGEDIALEKLFGVPDRDLSVMEDAFKGQSPRGKRRIMFQVKEAGVKLASEYDAYTNEEFGTDWPIAMKAREMYVRTDEAREKLATISGLTDRSQVDPSDLVQVLEEFDTENHLIHLYGKRVPDPYQSVYGRTLEKSAEETALINGEPVGANKLKELITSKYDSLSESFGKEAADQLMQDPVTVFNSLPVPERMAIQELFN